MIGKPLDFAALAGSSALQRAVVALHDEARRWPGGADRQVESGMDYELTRMIAEETISRHGVPPDRVNHRVRARRRRRLVATGGAGRCRVLGRQPPGPRHDGGPAAGRVRNGSGCLT